MPSYTVYSDKVEINAPQEVVWEILVDLNRYGEWNPFTYRVDTRLLPGEPVELYVRMPKRGDRVQREQVRTVDRPVTLAWGMKLGFEFLLNALREQRLVKIDENRCTYQTWDSFSGLLTPLVVKLFEEDVQNGFNNVAYALKARAELQWRGSL